MLSKNNKILIGCLALLLVMSVGYALFSDTITINGTATAKGDFDINVSCQNELLEQIPKGTRFFKVIGDSGFVFNDNNYKNDICSIYDDEVAFNVELTQPRAEKTFIVKLTNNGSIDSVVKTSTGEGIKLTYERCEGNFETNEFSNCTSIQDGVDTIIDFDIIGYSLSDGVVKPLITGDPYNVFQGFTNNFIDSDDILLKSGNSVYLRFTAKWDDSDYDQNLPISGSGSAYYKETIKALFDFIQVTN